MALRKPIKNKCELLRFGGNREPVTLGSVEIELSNQKIIRHDHRRRGF